MRRKKREKPKTRKNRFTFLFASNGKRTSEDTNAIRDTGAAACLFIIMVAAVAATPPQDHPHPQFAGRIYEIKNEAETAQIPKRYAQTKQVGKGPGSWSP